MVAQLPPISLACWERAFTEMAKAETGCPVLDEFIEKNPELLTPFLEQALSICTHLGRGALVMWLALRYQIEENQIKDLEALIQKE